jgi:hypothetical protein
MTETELLAAIAKALGEQATNNGPVGITTAELAEAQGVTVNRALALVKSLIKAGKIRPVKVARQRIDGAACWSPGWAIVEAKR